MAAPFSFGYAAYVLCRANRQTGGGRGIPRATLIRAENPSQSHAQPPQRCVVPTSKSIAASEISAALERLATALSQRHPGPEKLLLLGIANGGITLAQRLGTRLPHARVGTVDISFHRDDIGQHPIPKEFAPTSIPADVNGATVVLVDDVLFSGRTVKAALDELFDHGRPARVELAVLVDRGGRKLPMAADYCGIKLDTQEREKVVVRLHATDPAQDVIEVKAGS